MKFVIRNTLVVLMFSLGAQAASITVPDTNLRFEAVNQYTDLSKLNVQIMTSCREGVMFKLPEGSTKPCKLDQVPVLTKIADGEYKLTGATMNYDTVARKLGLSTVSIEFRLVVDGQTLIIDNTNHRTDDKVQSRISEKFNDRTIYVTNIPLFSDLRYAVALNKNQGSISNELKMSGYLKTQLSTDISEEKILNSTDLEASIFFAQQFTADNQEFSAKSDANSLTVLSLERPNTLSATFYFSDVRSADSKRFQSSVIIVDFENLDLIDLNLNTASEGPIQFELTQKTFN